MTPAVNNSLHRLASVHTLVNDICARKIARAFGVCVAADARRLASNARNAAAVLRHINNEDCVH